MVVYTILLMLVLMGIGCAPDQGPQGMAGTPGLSCSVEPVVNGAVISCPDGSMAVILNGADAVPTSYSVVNLITPCPSSTTSSGLREVILQLQNGILLAHHSGRGNEFLAPLSPGNYRLTDGSGCDFTVNPDMTVVW